MSGVRFARAGLSRDRVWAVTACTALAALAPGLAPGSVGFIGIASAVGILAGRIAQVDWGMRARNGWRALNALVLVGCVGAGMAGVPLLTVGVVLVSWLAVHRAATASGPQDDRIALLLALLQVLLGCILTLSSLLVVVFLGLLLMAPPALLLCHLSESLDQRPMRGQALSSPTRRRRLALLGPLCLALTLGFFFTIPRIDPTELLASGADTRISGFGDEVDLGALGAILENPEVVARIRVFDADGAGVREAFYLRGTALDRFDGKRWVNDHRQHVTGTTPPGGDAAGPRDRFQEVQLEPGAADLLLGMAEIQGMRGGTRSPGFAALGPRGARTGAVPGLQRDVNGSWRWAGGSQGIAYTVRSVPVLRDAASLRDTAPDPAASLWGREERDVARAGAWLQVPDDLDPRVVALTRTVLEDEVRADPTLLDPGTGSELTPYDKAVAIERWLRRHHTWSLTPAPGLASQPLERFLFETRQGHCEYFATAAAVMLRVAGVPARVVNGFHVDEYNELGGWFVVRQSDAHSWVEAHLGRQGWVGFDGTPVSQDMASSAGVFRQLTDWVTGRWRAVVLDYDLTTQLEVARTVGRSVRLPTAQDSRDSIWSGLFAWVPLLLTGVLVLALLLAARAVLGWLAGERTAAPLSDTGRVERTWRRALRLVARRGWALPAGLPPVAAARWLQDQAGPSADPLVELAWIRYRVRYNFELDADLASRAVAELTRLGPLVAATGKGADTVEAAQEPTRGPR